MGATMTVYSYIVTHDSGFAPNPFHGRLTLACCKPAIRRSAHVGDLVIGLSRRSERIVYATRVSEVLSIGDYWGDVRFAAKTPDMTSRSMVARQGDNIYEPFGIGTFRQLPSRHSHDDGSENPESMRDDLGGGRVLVAAEFVYFGGDGPELPEALSFLSVGRGHRCKFTPAEVQAVVEWFAAQPRGVRGRPAMWRSDDESWREAR